MADEKTPAVAKPHRTAKGQLTRAGMEAVLKAGGSVLHQGEILTDLSQLPAEADIVRGDAEASAALAASLDEQIAALSAQRARLAKQQEEALAQAGRQEKADAAQAKQEAREAKEAAAEDVSEDETAGDEQRRKRGRHPH